jgi:hypothetical protein
MNAPANLPARITEKPNEQLIEMLRRPQDWLPEALDLARAELQRRGLPNLEVNPPPPADAPGRNVLKKINPYYLVVAGCLVHAVVLRLLGNQVQLAGWDHSLPHWAPPWWLWLGSLLIWPVWSVALWRRGRKKKLAVVIPMIVGLVLMWPMLEMIFDMITFLVGMAMGGKT